MTAFRQWMHHEMTTRGLTARELGRRSGVNHSTITRILNGEREPLLLTVQQLAAVFDAQYVPRRAYVPPRVDPARNPAGWGWGWSDERLDAIFVAVVNYGIVAGATSLGLSPFTVNHAAGEFRARYGAVSNAHAVYLTWARLGHRYVLGSAVDERPAHWGRGQ